MTLWTDEIARGLPALPRTVNQPEFPVWLASLSLVFDKKIPENRWTEATWQVTDDSMDRRNS